MKRRLPKLYAPIKIKFWSLRTAMAQNGGVIFDCDTEVERLVVRVLCPGGWKWQIKNLNDILKWDLGACVDQECLEMNGSDLEFEYI